MVTTQPDGRKTCVLRLLSDNINGLQHFAPLCYIPHNIQRVDYLSIYIESVWFKASSPLLLRNKRTLDYGCRQTAHCIEYTPEM